MAVDLPPQVLQAFGIPSPVPGLSPIGGGSAPVAPPPPVPDVPQPPQPSQVPPIAQAPLPSSGPPPFDSSLSGAPHPQLLQTPPPPAPIDLPVTSPMIDRGQDSPDYVVPASAFGHPGQGGPTPAGIAAAAAPSPSQQPSTRSAGAPALPAPSLPSPEQQFAQVRQREDTALDHGIRAIADKAAVEQQQAQDDLAAQRIYDDKIATIEKQRAAQAAEYAKVSSEKQAYMDSTLHAVDSYKLDQGKYMKQIGVGGTVGWAIAAVLAGVGQALQRNNGPNPVIGMLQDRIKQSIAAQMDERDQLKERYGRAEHDYDRYQQYSASRSAQLTALEAQADRWLSNQIREAGYKAASPMARANAEAAASQLETSAADKARQSVKDATDYDMSKRKLAVEQGQLGVAQQNANETARHNKATEALTGDQRDLELLKLQEKNKDDRAKLERERGIGGEVTPVRDADGKVVGYQQGLITKKDGSVWIPNGTETSVTALQKKHNAAAALVKTIDEIRALGPEWLSDSANSDKLQRMRQLMGDARLQAIAAKDLGVPTGHDIELAENFLGTPDPTRFRDSVAGLKQSRDSIIRDHNVELANAGLDKPWEPPDRASLPKSTPTETEKLSTMLKAKPDQTPEAARDAAFNAAYRELRGTPDALPKARIAGEAAAEAAKDGKPSPDQRNAIDALKAHVVAADPQAGVSLDALKDVAATAKSKYIRDLAAQALSEIESRSRQEPITSAGVRYDPNAFDPAGLVSTFQQPRKPTFSPQ